MHDVGRTQQYMEAGYPQEIYGEVDGRGEYGLGHETYEAGMGYETPYEVYGETFQGEAPLILPNGEINTDMEVALAAELLGVQSEEELNYFLGGLVRRIGRGLGKFARSGVGRSLIGGLRSVAKAALPTLGGLAGSFIPVPGVGTALGNMAGSALASALETNGVSLEDRELDTARRVIRTAIESAQQYEMMPQSEFMGEDELWNLVKGAASRLLPAAASLIGSASGAGGAQGSGAGWGGLRFRSPGGYQVDVGGGIGGQGSVGAAAGINAPAPPVPFQTPGPIPPIGPRPIGGGAGGPGIGRGRRPMAGRWIRRGRTILVLNA